MDYESHVALKQTAEDDAARLSSDRHAASALQIIDGVRERARRAARVRNALSTGAALAAAATALVAIYVTH